MDDAVVKRFGDRHVRILPLSLAQREEFITKWFRYVHSPGSETGERTAPAMIGEIRTHPGVEKLIDNPLMLTAVCILYHDGRELPGQRAEQYKKDRHQPALPPLSGRERAGARLSQESQPDHVQGRQPGHRPAAGH